MSTNIEIPAQPLNARGFTTLQICIYLAVLPFGETLTVMVEKHKGKSYSQAVRMQMSRARQKARAQSRTGALLYEFHLQSEVESKGDVEYVTFHKTQTLSQKMETAVKKRMMAAEQNQAGDE